MFVAEKLEFCDPYSFLVEAVEAKGPHCTTAFPDPGGTSKQVLRDIYDKIMKVRCLLSFSFT